MLVEKIYIFFITLYRHLKEAWKLFRAQLLPQLRTTDLLRIIMNVPQPPDCCKGNHRGVLILGCRTQVDYGYVPFLWISIEKQSTLHSHIHFFFSFTVCNQDNCKPYHTTWSLNVFKCNTGWSVDKMDKVRMWCWGLSGFRESSECDWLAAASLNTWWSIVSYLSAPQVCQCVWHAPDALGMAQMRALSVKPSTVRREK